MLIVLSVFKALDVVLSRVENIMHQQVKHDPDLPVSFYYLFMRPMKPRGSDPQELYSEASETISDYEDIRIF